MDYDEDRIYYSYQNLQSDRGDAAEVVADNDDNNDDVNLPAVKRHFREFLSK
jgi:hypothetical protein